MIQIAFQPAYDSFHAIFRFFQIRSVYSDSMELDRYRIIDYYLCFPDQLSDFRFAPKHTKFRKLGERYARQNNFERRPASSLILGRMRLVQMAALETLGREGYLSPDLLGELRVAPTSKPVPDKISDRVSVRAESEAELMTVLAALTSDYGLVGPSGLKSRSNLLEHKYDAV